MTRPDRRFTKGAAKDVMFARLFARARAHVAAGRLAEAFALAEKALDLDPSAEDMESLTCLGRGLSRGAVYDVLAALKASPAGASPWGRQLRVELLQRLSRAEEAFLEARAFSALPPRHAWMRFHLGDLLLRCHFDYPAAEAEFAAALESAPVFWKARGLSAEAALCAGDRRRALLMFDGLVRDLRGFDRAAALAWRGEAKLWCGRYEDALADLDGAVRGRSRLARCWRGAAQLRLGRIDRALEDLNVALREAPDDAEARLWRGETLRQAGRADAARVDLDRSLRLNPRNPFALCNRALLSLAGGDAEAARRDLRGVSDDVLIYFEWRERVLVDGSRSDRALAELALRILEAGGGVRRGERYLAPLWLGARP